MSDLTSLANVKQWLSIADTDTDSDAFLSRLITAASAYAESWMERTVLSATYTDVRDGTGTVRMLLRNGPVTAVAAVSVDYNSIPLATVSSTYGYVWVSEPPSVRLRGYLFTRGILNVSVTYTAGYATVPPDIEQGVIELVGRKFKTIDRIGIQSKSLAGEQITFSATDMNTEIKNCFKQHLRAVAP